MTHRMSAANYYPSDRCWGRISASVISRCKALRHAIGLRGEFHSNTRGVNAMIPILPILDPLTRLAAAAMEHVNMRKAGLGSGSNQDAARRIKELEDSDFEQAQLISELSESVEHLAEAVQSQIEESRRREAKLRLLVYLSLVFGFASLVIALAPHFR